MQIILSLFPFIWSIIVAILHFLGIYEASMTILIIAAVGVILFSLIIITIIVFQIKKFLKKIRTPKDNKEIREQNEEFSKIIHEQTMTLDEVFNSERKNDEEDLR